MITLYIAVLPNYFVSCYPSMRKREPSSRILQAPIGDTSLPANNFTIDGGTYIVWYEITQVALNGTNATLNSTTNSTTNVTTNITVVVNGTNATSTTNATLIADMINDTTLAVPYITVAIKFHIPGEFFAIGWGAPTMIGADVWAFEFINGIVQVSDRKAIGHFEPPHDTDLGGTSDVEMLGYEIAETYTLVKVRRKLDTGDAEDNLINVGSNEMCWAYHNSLTVEFHEQDKGVLTSTLIVS